MSNQLTMSYEQLESKQKLTCRMSLNIGRIKIPFSFDNGVKKSGNTKSDINPLIQIIIH